MNAQGALAANNAELAVDLASEADQVGLLQLTGTFTATVQLQVTVDESTWVTTEMTPVAGGAGVTTVTAPGLWRVALGGARRLRALMTPFTSGSAVATLSVQRQGA